MDKKEKSMTESDGFRKEDIFILLDAYKNQIESNRTLMEQQSKLIDKHQTIAESLANIIDKFDNYIAISKLETIESRTSCFKDHNSLKMKIYFAYGGMLSIITSLIGLLYLLHEKNEVLKKVLEAVEKIIRHLRL